MVHIAINRNDITVGREIEIAYLHVNWQLINAILVTHQLSLDGQFSILIYQCAIRSNAVTVIFMLMSKIQHFA